MAMVITADGVVDESTLTWRLWREDAGESWTIVHELTDREGRVVRRDAWVNFKGNGGLGAGVTQGESNG